MASTLKCDFCGAAGFLDNWALRGHQAWNGLCKAKQRAAERAAQTDEGVFSVHPRSEGTSSLNVECRDAAPMEFNDDVQDLQDLSNDLSFEDILKRLQEDSIGTGDKEFDVMFQLLFFIRQCHNGGGLSRKDINQLLRLLHHPQFNVQNVHVYSASDVCKYEDKLRDDRDDLTWSNVEIRKQTEDTCSINLPHRNPLHILESLFSSPKNQEGFALHSSPVSDESERVYTNLQSGEWWREMDEDVEQICSGGVVAPIILYSDQTSLSHNKRTQGWLVVMTIGNIPCNMRSLPEGHSLLAVLPVLGADDQGLQESKMPSRAKLDILHQCQEIILDPLKEASHTGLHLKDPFGNSQWVYPRLCLYICDQTEGSRMTCTFDTNKCQFPCSCCFCPKKSLSAVAKRFPYRSEDRMKEIFNQMVQSPFEEKERLSKHHFVHPLKCALWGFSGTNLSYGSPYRSIQVDGLHQSILGVFKTLVGIVRELKAPNLLVTHPLRELDKRLQIIIKIIVTPHFGCLGVIRVDISSLMQTFTDLSTNS